jgi:hypothetical protein
MREYPEHTKLTFNNFKGMWSRGDTERCPPDHLSLISNMYVKDGQLITRPGSSLYQSLGGTAVIDVFPYKGNTAATNGFITSHDNFFIIFWPNSGGFISLGSLAGWDGKMSCIQIGTRIYIMPYTNTGYNMYVWDVAWAPNPMREAGFLAPAGGAMAIAIGGAGKIERGTHIYKVCYETDTGFLSKASTTAFIAFGSNGNEFHNLSGVPTGPTGTAARVILVTKGIQRYNNDDMNQEYFFLPGGRIAGNVATTLNGISYYDADLQSSADYLLDQLERVPSARSLAYYNGRLITIGDKDDRNVIRISKNGEPESFDAVDGFIETAPSTIRGAEDVAEDSGILYIFKAGFTLYTQDNNDVPSTWTVETVDKDKFIIPGLSTTLPSKGVAKISGYTAVIEGNILVATMNGLFLFKAGFKEELSWKISSIWSASLTGSQLQDFYVDPINKKILVRFSGSSLLIADYSIGLNPKDIMWYNWSIPVATPSGSGCFVDELNRTTISWFMALRYLNSTMLSYMIYREQ